MRRLSIRGCRLVGLASWGRPPRPLPPPIPTSPLPPRTSTSPRPHPTSPLPPRPPPHPCHPPPHTSQKVPPRRQRLDQQLWASAEQAVHQLAALGQQQDVQGGQHQGGGVVFWAGRARLRQQLLAEGLWEAQPLVQRCGAGTGSRHPQAAAGATTTTAALLRAGRGWGGALRGWPIERHATPPCLPPSPSRPAPAGRGARCLPRALHSRAVAGQAHPICKLL